MAWRIILILFMIQCSNQSTWLGTWRDQTSKYQDNQNSGEMHKQQYQRSNRTSLETEHLPKIGIYRILGNDLPPRHSPLQTLSNLQFILENEQEFESCEKWWVLNRIVDQSVESNILRLLQKHNQRYFVIPFEQAEYQKIGFNLALRPQLNSEEYFALSPSAQRQRLDAAYHDKNIYVMNNNGGRNTALRHGKLRYDWTFPFDGNIFLSDEAVAKIREGLANHRYIIAPMARTTGSDNNQILSPEYVPKAVEEPQIGFHKESKLEFDETYRYGRRPKVQTD